jgi:hypothetical protein
MENLKMATVYLTFTITKTFEEWKAVFDADQDNLASSGIKTLAVGYQLDTPNTVRVAFSADSQKVVEDFTQQNTTDIESSGHVLESTIWETFSS